MGVALPEPWRGRRLDPPTSTPTLVHRAELVQQLAGRGADL